MRGADAMLMAVQKSGSSLFPVGSAGDWEPRRGEELKAQGNALGNLDAKTRALKGRNHTLVSPLQGDEFF